MSEQLADSSNRVNSAQRPEEASPEVNLSAAVEAICMVADEPVATEQLASVLNVSPGEIAEVCGVLASEYSEQGRGFVFVNVAGGWRYQSAPEQAVHVEQFVLDGQNARMSGAALETLAIVAYKQPISRAQIAAIRGVNVDGVLKTLQQRGYVSAVGQIEGGGQAQFFGTTSLFLEKLGIATLEDLPPLGAFIPGADLVETLEQGLRPSAALDLDDADALEAVIEEEAAVMTPQRESQQEADRSTPEPQPQSQVESDATSQEAHHDAGQESGENAEPKKRWWRPAGRS